MSDGGFDGYPVPPLPPPPSPPFPPMPPAPRATRSRKRLFWFLIGVSALFIVFIAILLVLASSFQSGEELDLAFSGDKVALVEVTGVIDEPRQTVDLIRKYAKDSSIRAIVLRIDSPGGGVAASQEIHEEVKRIRDRGGKPIVASMSTVAASGGYYIACAASKIIANPGSITGSIGVIANWTNYEDLFRWAKLKDVTFKSGPLKDAGSPLRETTPEEREYFQGLVNELYEQFVQSVAEGRRMEVDKVKHLADGRVYTGAQAKKLGLIDEIGNLPDAVALAGKLAGIKGEPKIVEPAKQRITLFDLLFGNIDKFLRFRGVKSRAVFEYRWSQDIPEFLEK